MYEQVYGICAAPVKECQNLFRHVPTAHLVQRVFGKDPSYAKKRHEVHNGFKNLTFNTQDLGQLSDFV